MARANHGRFSILSVAWKLGGGVRHVASAMVSAARENRITITNRAHPKVGWALRQRYLKYRVHRQPAKGAYQPAMQIIVR